MIKFLGTSNGKPLYGFGLSEENCKRLVAGRPIIIDLDVMAKDSSPSDQRGAVLIFGGKTDQDLADEMLKGTGKIPASKIRKQDDSEDQP